MRTTAVEKEPALAGLGPLQGTVEADRNRATVDLGQLFDHHAPLLLRVVERIAGPGEHVEDIVQDVYLTAHRKLDSIPAGAEVKAWLCAIAINLVRHHHRGVGRRRKLRERLERLEVLPEPVPPDEALARLRQAQRVRACIYRLPLKQREVFVLYELEGISGRQIATTLDVAENTVWTRLHHARRRFRRMWRVVQRKEMSTSSRPEDRRGGRGEQRRLVACPDFIEQTGIRLADDELLLEEHDLPRLKGRALARAASGASPTVAAAGATGAKSTLAGAALAVLAGVAGYLGMGSPGEAPPRVEKPACRRAARSVRSTTASGARVRAAVVPARKASSHITAKAKAGEVQRAWPRSDGQPRRPRGNRRGSRGKRRGSRGKNPGPAGPVPSTLAEQLSLYERGQSLLAAGDPRGAGEAFRRYRHRYPGGELWQEASLSLLETQLRLRRLGEARHLARQLLGTPDLGRRRAEVLRAYGEVLALLGQCDRAAAALSSAQKQPGAGISASTVRKALASCRPGNVKSKGGDR